MMFTLADKLFFTGIGFCLIGIILCGAGAWIMLGER